MRHILNALLEYCKAGVNREKDKCDFINEYEKGISKGRELELEYLLELLENIKKGREIDV